MQDRMLYPREACHTVVRACACACVHSCVHVCVSWGSNAFISLGSKHLYPLSPFPGPKQRFIEHLKQFGQKFREHIIFLCLAL